MTQTLHEIVMQLNAEEGLTPDALWALKHLAEMKGDELAAAQKRVAELEAALRPFAAMSDSPFFCDGLHEGDRYAVVLAQYNTDFTGADVIRARAALAGNGDA
jgi:hypothetical protein